ncbi:protein BCL9 homolog isoform X3 [Chironomus tepperi]|uniref:protein BCL9 homolog isoform X3 n=1 Tax=Chironomus tepperi TaxID=113505 RepID=UPI00391F3AD3
MIKDKKEKQSGGSASGSSSGSNGNSKSNNNANNATNSSNTNNSSTSSPSSSKTSSSNSSSKSSSSNTNKNNILGIKEEIIEQGPTEQLIVTSIKHEDGSPPTNIIKKEPANSASTAGNGPGSASASNVNSNDSNNNNDTNDNKNSSNLSGLPDEKDSANDNSIADELLNNDELNSSGNGNNSSSSKLGMHIKNEDPSSDPLAGVDSNMNPNNFGPMNSQQPGSNRQQGSPERIQPLPSNVVNKQSNSMDYMQQQSQIFVFSTALANKGADSVRSGQFPTIIAYHCAQPETRKFLQKFPLKVNQFNRSGPGWFPQQMGPNMNSNKKIKMSMDQQNFNFIKNNAMNPQQGPGNGPMNQMRMHPGGGNAGFQSSCDMNNPDGNNMGMWGSGNQQMNMDPLGNGPSIDPLLSDPIDSLVNDPLASSPMGNLPQMGNNSNSCMDPTSPNIPSLQGVKVPDEDLTPQQRQQRALKLAQLQELKQMFKQEHPMNPNDMNQMNEQDNPLMPGGGAPCSKMGPNPMSPMMQGGGGGPGPMMNTPHGPMNSMNMNGPMRPNFPPGMVGPRGGNMNMCRPPMGPNNMGMNPDEMMGGGPCNTGGNGMNNMSMGPGGMMGIPPQMQGNNMGMVPGSCMMPGNGPMGGGPMNQKGNMPMGPGGNMQQQQQQQQQQHMDWNKMQQQYYEDNNKRKGPPMMGGMDMPGNDMNPINRMPPGMRNMPNMQNMRVPQQGPPPPYHQTPRSASVPIATQSPNPNSPNNPTSNLSLPSPRGGSTLNSPAAGDPSRMNPQQFKHMNPRQSPTTSSQDSPAMGRQINHSNPSTPISSHLSPSASLKDLDMSTNPSQELTIQKQPNANINKDGTPNIGGPNQANLNLDNRLPGQKTPTSSANSHMNNFSIPSSPHTTGAPTLSGDKNRINSAGPSPQNNLQRSNSMMGNDPTQFSPHPQGNNQQSNESNMQFPNDTPNMPFGPNVQQNNNKMPNFMDQKPGDGVGPQFPSCSGRPENLPLNPNSNAAMPNTKPSHFDPISSLAQMSQQLTSTGVPNPMNGQPMMGGFNNNGMMNDMGPMGMSDGQMDFGGNMGNMGPNQFPMGPGGPRSMSPKIGPQMGFPPNGPGGGMPPNMRMVRPPMGYNGTNIQVKPNAPNTIQYLPARPQMNNSNPPRPPSLEFLQRYTNPMGMDEMNKGAAPNIVGNQQNMPYFPNQNNPNQCMGPGMDPMDGGPPPGMMNQNPMMMRGGGMRGNMRFPGPPSGNINNPCMMGNNTFNSSNNPNMNDHQMMFGGGPGPNQQNPQMFVAGPKSSPIPQPNPDQMQMMGGGGNGPHFNKQQQSHFPSTTDPNYAQQYHNFQQQLYATNNTSNQRNQMGMGGNQAPFMPK